MRIYLDSSIAIYLVERNPDFYSQVSARFDDALLAGAKIASSDLVRLECRVLPVRVNDIATLEEYERFFESADDWCALSGAVYDLATEIRALTSVRTPDALHLAAERVNHFETPGSRYLVKKCCSGFGDGE